MLANCGLTAKNPPRRRIVRTVRRSSVRATGDDADWEFCGREKMRTSGSMILRGERGSSSTEDAAEGGFVERAAAITQQPPSVGWAEAIRVMGVVSRAQSSGSK